MPSVVQQYSTAGTLEVPATSPLLLHLLAGVLGLRLRFCAVNSSKCCPVKYRRTQPPEGCAHVFRVCPTRTLTEVTGRENLLTFASLQVHNLKVHV